MNKAILSTLFACVLVVVGVALRAASAQDRTPQPGQLTQGKVWIQNRGTTEAVPVSIENTADAARPLRVQLTGNPTVTIGSGSVQTRAVRQTWEYQSVTIPSGQASAAVLNAAGADGWEATGVTFATQGGTVVVMKRPR